MNCIVDQCPGAGRELFRVPNGGTDLFKRWQKLVNVSGLGTERICSRHFNLNDFSWNFRLKLKSAATPRLHLPLGNSKISPKGKGCCIRGCASKNPSEMVKFPPLKLSVHKKWIAILGVCDNTDALDMLVCHKHFRTDDFDTLRTRYLKPNAIPSKKLVRPVKVKSGRIAQDLKVTDVTAKPRSNRMCSVVGCTIKATTEFFLHAIPKEKARMQAWINAIKSGKKPTKNTFICNNHFHSSDYLPGTKKLRKTAVPSMNLPLTIVATNQSARAELNPYKKPAMHGSRSNRTTERVILVPEVDKGSDENEEPNISSVESMNSRDLSNNVRKEPFEQNMTETHFGYLNDLKELPFFEDLDNNNNSDGKNCACFLDKGYEYETIESVQNTILKISKTRQTILSDLLITDKDINIWTGLPSMNVLVALTVSAQNLEHCYPKKLAMHISDRVILTLARLKQNISFAALSTLFRISPNTVSDYFSYTVQILAKILCKAVYWPSSEEIRNNIPRCFRDQFEKVRCVLDCTEIKIASPNCLNCRIATYSSYKGVRTAKFLISVTPAGTISFCSRAYSGKASDKFIFNGEKIIDKLDKYVDHIMVDKGFAIQTECVENGIFLHIPPLLLNEQHSEPDAILNESIAKARVHVERAISRVKVFRVLQTAMDGSMIKHVDDIMQIICGIVNLSSPILRDDKF